MWGLGQGTRFFLLMCVAVALEHGSEVTGRVGGLWGRGDYGVDNWVGHFDN